MIILKFLNKKETRIPKESYVCSDFRWTFQIIFYRGFTIGFVHQHKINGKWYDSHVMKYIISITKYFHLGSDHVYYDGQHCMFSIGFIHFCWLNDNCKKCYSK